MTEIITDAKGRKLHLRRLTVLDQVKLMRAIGPAQSGNEAVVNVCMMAASVTQIDDVPIMLPKNEAQIDAIIERLGDEGYAALMLHTRKQIAALEDAAEEAAKADPLAKPAQ